MHLVQSKSPPFGKVNLKYLLYFQLHESNVVGLALVVSGLYLLIIHYYEGLQFGSLVLQFLLNFLKPFL